MDIRSPRYLADGRIDCEVNHPTYGWVPFTADKEDPEPHGRAIFAAAEQIGPAAYVPPPPPSDAELSRHIRSQRDAKLRDEVDPVVSNPLRWADMTAEQQQAWADYRTALLDVPQQAGFPHDITWPSKPE